jgi:hypothetical protein
MMSISEMGVEQQNHDRSADWDNAGGSGEQRGDPLTIMEGSSLPYLSVFFPGMVEGRLDWHSVDGERFGLCFCFLMEAVTWPDWGVVEISKPGRR